MPIDFLTEEQKQNYGRYAAEPNEVQLSSYFILDENDLIFIAQRRGDQNRLGIALQLTSVRFLGAFLPDLALVPHNVQTFVATQLSISRTDILAEYAKREPTRWEHYAQIKKYYHYHEFGEFPWTFRLNRLLYTRAWISNERPSLMFDFATAWLVQHKILLPGTTTLSRVITEIRERAANRLWQRLLALPNDEQKRQLDELLSFSEGQRVSMFEQLKKGPVTVSSPAFNDALDRYNKLHQLGFQQLDFTGLPPAQLKSLARYANVTSVKKIVRIPMKKRTAILIAFVKSLEVIALDEAIDVLDMLITNIAGEAKKAGQKKRLRTLKDLDRSSLILAKACALLLDEVTDDSHLRKSIFSCISKERLAESVKMVNELARPADNNFQDEMIEQYGRVRRFLPRVLRELTFLAAPAGEHTLAAFNYLSSLGASRKHILDDAPKNIITGPWKRLVFDEEGRVRRPGYSLCLLERFQDALRRRDIYLENSDRWGDPRSKLLQGTEWQAQRVSVCRAL